MMIIILAIDALEYELVERFNNRNLMQHFHGKTDISEFSQPRTIVLWSSFMTGRNCEKEILAKGDREMWNTRIDQSETFFKRFNNPSIIDLPGFNYDLEAHERSRSLLKSFFNAETEKEKNEIREKYNTDAFAHHKKIKEVFLPALDGVHDLVLGYFSLADVIGHLNYGNTSLMRMIYSEMDDIARTCAEKECPLLILSDHGMKPIGMFGDHSEYGFWSLNRDKGISTPRITDFFTLIDSLQD